MPDVVDRHHAHPELIGQPRIHHPRLGTRQHDPRPDRDPGTLTRPSEQLITLVTGQHELTGGHRTQHTKIIETNDAHFRRDTLVTALRCDPKSQRPDYVDYL